MNTNTNTKNLDQLRSLLALRNELLLAEARDAAYKSQAETTAAWRRYEILAAVST